MKRLFFFSILIAVTVIAGYIYKKELTNVCMETVKRCIPVVVTGISVEGCVTTKPGEIETLSGIKRGVHILDVSDRSLRRVPAGAPAVAAASLKRGIHGWVTIVIRERKPVACIHLNRVHLIDSTGFLWPRTAADRRNVPLITGLMDTVSPFGRALDHRSTDRLMRCLTLLRRIRDDFHYEVSRIQFKGHGRIQAMFVSSGCIVEFNEELLKTGVENLRTVLYAMGKRENGLPHRIDCSYENMAYIQ